MISSDGIIARSQANDIFNDLVEESLNVRNRMALIKERIQHLEPAAKRLDHKTEESKILSNLSFSCLIRLVTLGCNNIQCLAKPRSGVADFMSKQRLWLIRYIQIKLRSIDLNNDYTELMASAGLDAQLLEINLLMCPLLLNN